MEYSIEGNYVKRNDFTFCNVSELVASHPIHAGKMIHQLFQEVYGKKEPTTEPTFARTLLDVVVRLREDYPHNKEAANIETAIAAFMIVNILW